MADDLFDEALDTGGSYADRLKAQARDKLGWDKALDDIVPDKEQAVDYDPFDALAWEMLYETIPVLKRSVREMRNEFDYVGPAYQDLFNTFFKQEVDFVDPYEMLDGYRDNHPLMEGLFDTDEVQHLREDTVFDEYNTAFSMLQMEDKMRDGFDAIKRAREAQAAAAQALEEALKAAENGEATDEQLALLEQALTDYGQTEEQMRQAQEQAVDEMAQVAQDTSEQIEQDKQSCAAYGIQDGVLQKMPFEERRALMEKLNIQKLSRLADLVGQWKINGDAEARKSVKASGIRANIEVGNDIPKLLNSELTNLAIPELEDLFFIGYAEHALLQWSETSEEKVGKGPIILICDESGSMSASVGKGYTREMWSKAIALTLADLAKRGDRDFIYLGFSSARQLFETRFLGGEQPIEQVIEFAGHFFKGGTNYIAPLERAGAIVKEYAAAGRAKPDIIFATDDDCHVAQSYVDKWSETRQQVGMTCYGIQIGTRSRNTLHDLCDKVINLSALNSKPEGMVELFRTI